MTELTGVYYDGKNPIPIPGTLRIDGSLAAVVAKGMSETFEAAQLLVTPAIGKALRFVNLPNRWQFCCHDNPILLSLPQESPTEGPVHWLEKRWGAAVAAVALMAFALAAGYFRGLPLIASRISTEVSLDAEKKFGDSVLKALDHEVLKPTQLYPGQIDKIRAGFETLVAGLAEEKLYRLNFRYAPRIGPNAFALPGGEIVITDQMVNFAKSTDEVMAVLAHEIGHEVHHHMLRLLVQNSVTGALAATLTHDASTIGGSISNAPLILADLRYSREFESEADDFAFGLLKERGISPLAFRSVMDRFAAKYKDTLATSFLSSHPSSEDRARKAFFAAMDFTKAVKVQDYKMAPTYWYGQRVTIEPMSAVQRGLERGDIIAVYSDDEGLSLRRIIGLPHDHFTAQNRVISLNGRDLTGGRLLPADCMARIKAIYGNAADQDPGSYECHHETVGSSDYLVYMDSKAFAVFQNFTVPGGKFWIFGDNRTTLTPTRDPYYDLVSKDEILGVVK